VNDPGISGETLLQPNGQVGNFLGTHGMHHRITVPLDRVTHATQSLGHLLSEKTGHHRVRSAVADKNRKIPVRLVPVIFQPLIHQHVGGKSNQAGECFRVP